MGAAKLLTAAGGAITLDAASTATDKTITLPATTGTMALTSQLNGFRNRIINGAMMIDQRNAGASVTPTNATYAIDRFINNLTQTSKLSVQQSSTAPAGFTNSMLVTSLSAYSITSTDNFQFEQRIEGLNCGDLAWGTASASAVTLSFWVRSSLTGTFGGSLRNNAGDRSYPFSYTINAANTWEQKTISIAGDTSGTWLTTNGVGIRVGFSLGTGSTLAGAAGSWAGANYLGATGATSVVGTNGATFYITGVQLEKGSTATSFDYRPYSTELALCQRYFQTSYAEGTAVGTITASYAVGRYVDAVTPSNYCGCPCSYPVRMRIVPTVTIYGVLSGATSGQVSGDSTNKTGAVFQSGFWGFNAGCNNVATSNAESVRYHFASTAEL